MRVLSRGIRLGIGRCFGVGLGLGVGVAVFAGSGEAWADFGPGTMSSGTMSSGTKGGNQRAVAAARSHRQRPATTARRAAPAASVVPAVRVYLPPMPVAKGRSFEVSRDVIDTRAADYVAGGGDSSDSARFFFGDLAVTSLDELAAPDVTPVSVRTRLGSLAVSGYFGGIWLRDNLRDPGTGPGTGSSPVAGASSRVSASAITLFGGLAASLTGAATGPDWLVNAAAHASVPVLLALYGYNRGYLQVILENPPTGVPEVQNSLSCNGFLDCDSNAFPLEIAGRYEAVLGKLSAPATLGWKEMALWAKVLENATGAGRFVWESIASAGAFSAKSYAALVDLSSAYLMVSKAAVLSAMLAAAEGDASVGRSSLRLQAGLWMWSGSYFGGLASKAPAGTIPSIYAGS